MRRCVTIQPHCKADLKEVDAASGSVVIRVSNQWRAVDPDKSALEN